MNGPSQHQFQVYSQGPPQPVTYTFTSPYTTPYYRPNPTQGTLSPQHLHPSLSSTAPPTGMPPGSFYIQTPGTFPPSSDSSASSTPSSSSVSTTSTVTPQQQQQQQALAEQQAQQRKERFEKSIRPLLQSSAFTGAGAVQSLVDKIDDYGTLEVEPSLRFEILTKMRDGAPNHYFRAWSENSGAIEITREWLKATFKSDKPEMVDTIMPLLHVRYRSITCSVNKREFNHVPLLDYRSTAPHCGVTQIIQARQDCGSPSQGCTFTW